MLSEQQADAVSNQLMMLERAKETDIKNLRARRVLWVHWLYKFPELATLEPWQQHVLLISAMEKADKQWPVLLSCFAWLALFLALLFLGPPTLQGFRGFLISTVVFGVPFALIRRREVRRHANALRYETFPEQ